MGEGIVAGVGGVRGASIRNRRNPGGVSTDPRAGSGIRGRMVVDRRRSPGSHWTKGGGARDRPPRDTAAARCPQAGCPQIRRWEPPSRTEASGVSWTGGEEDRGPALLG